VQLVVNWRNAMRYILQAVLVGSVMLAGCGESESLKELSSAEIEKLLKGNIVEGTLIMQPRAFRQYFGADGVTVQLTDKKRVGRWQIDDKNHFCVRWDKQEAENGGEKDGVARGTGTVAESNPKGHCFGVKQDSRGKYRIYSVHIGYAAILSSIAAGDPGQL
jgi:hypothetical protein